MVPTDDSRGSGRPPWRRRAAPEKPQAPDRATSVWPWASPRSENDVRANPNSGSRPTFHLLRFPDRSRNPDLNIVHGAIRLRHRVTVLGQPFQMKLQGLFESGQGLLGRVVHRHAPGHVRGEHAVTLGAFLDHHGETGHETPHYRLACQRMLSSSLGGRSLLSLPDTVTFPFLTGCLYCRCPLLDLTRYQPSLSISLMISRTFTAAAFRLLPSAVLLGVLFFVSRIQSRRYRTVPIWLFARWFYHHRQRRWRRVARRLASTAPQG